MPDPLSGAAMGSLIADQRKRIKFALPGSQNDTPVCLAADRVSGNKEISPSVQMPSSLVPVANRWPGDCSRNVFIRVLRMNSL